MAFVNGVLSRASSVGLMTCVCEYVYTLVRRGGVCGVMVKDGEMLLRDVLQLVGAEG